MFRCMKFIIVIVSMLYCSKTIEGNKKVEIWFLLLSLGLVFISIIYFSRRLIKE